MAVLGAGVVLALLALMLTARTLARFRVSVLLAFVWAGFAALPLHGAVSGTPMLERALYGTYTARIDEVVSNNGAQQRWIVSAIDGEPDWAVPQVRRARIIVSSDVPVLPGDMIAARIRFYPVPAPAVPGGYDSQFTSYFDGIGAFGNVLGDLEVTAPAPGGIKQVIEMTRQSINERIVAVLGERIGGIAVALITGDQSRIVEEDRDVMAVVGLAHILSISGLHLTLVAGTMFAFLRIAICLFPGASQRVPTKKIAAAAGIVTACAYLLISGMSVPAVRSTLMISLIFAAVLFGRQALTMRNVAIAGLLIAALDPSSIFGASYQLSFAAVVALIAAYELYRNRETSGEKSSATRRYLYGMALTSIVAGLATLLFSLYHFQQSAPFGVLGNLAAMPVVSFVMMPAALIATLLIPFGLEQPVYLVMGWSIEAMLWIAHAVRAISGGYNPSPILSPVALVFGHVALGWMAFFQTRLRLIGPVLLVPAVLAFGLERAPDILVADQTQALAVRHNGTLSLMAGRTGSFATNVWSERYIEPVESNAASLRCDPQGCILDSSEGFSVALVKNYAAFAEDCAYADIVVARRSVPESCSRSGTVVIDQHALMSMGTHALYWDAAARAFSLKTAITDPDRPWRIRGRR